MSKETDIGTDQAYVQKMLDNAAVYAASYVDLQRELNRMNKQNGILTGVLIALLAFTSWAAYEVTERISVNEIRINQVEARI